MGKTIRWSMKDPAGCVQRGQMPLSQLPGILRDFENSAAETLRRTGADHVLYESDVRRGIFKGGQQGARNYDICVT